MNREEQLTILEEREKENRLADIVIAGIPIWDIIKHPLREKYLVNTGHLERIHNKRANMNPSSLWYVFVSFIHFLKLVSGMYKSSNLLVGFSRFEKVGNLYVDKYVDPLVKLTNLKDDYLYLEYGTHGLHFQNRTIDRRFYTDYINIISRFVGCIWGVILYNKYKREILSFCKKASFCLGFEVKTKWVARKIATFSCLTSLYSLLLKRCNIKRVFGVSRIIFNHVAFAAKKLDVPVYELQHGITVEKTPLYMGQYNPDIDPDLFLLFGEGCPRNVFGVPEENTLQIGWAFFDFLKEDKQDIDDSRCLLISSADISDKIISVGRELAEKHHDIQFDIRRHPMEIYNSDQKSILEKTANLNDVSSSECSAAAIMKYKYIIGEGSSVLYEALCMGKKVARLACIGVELRNRSEDDAFYYLDDLSQFDDFLKAPHKELKKRAYTKFDKDLFNSLLK